MPIPVVKPALAAIAAAAAIAFLPTGQAQSRQGGGATGGVQPARIPGGTFEASGVVSVPGASGALFVDDGRPREVYWLPLGGDGRSARAVPVPIGLSVVDMEGITTDGTFFYVVGSQSKPGGVTGPGLVRFRFDPAAARVSDVTAVGRLKEWLASRVPELAAGRTRTGENIFNIEALAWDAAGARLLVGFRAPVPDGQALVVPVKLRQPDGAFTAENLIVESAPIRLDLGGAGLRALEAAPGGGFQLVAEPVKGARGAGFRLMSWDGRSRSATLVRPLDANLKAEGVTAAPDGPARTLVVFDTGRYALLP